MDDFEFPDFIPEHVENLDHPPTIQERVSGLMRDVAKRNIDPYTALALFDGDVQDFRRIWRDRLAENDKLERIDADWSERQQNTFVYTHMLNVLLAAVYDSRGDDPMRENRYELMPITVTNSVSHITLKLYNRDIDMRVAESIIVSNVNTLYHSYVLDNPLFPIEDEAAIKEAEFLCMLYSVKLIMRNIFIELGDVNTYDESELLQ